MGLLQRAYETYEALAPRYAGVYSAELREPLAPVGHWVTGGKTETTLTQEGGFISARAMEKEEKILFPVTEASAGRTSGAVAPHPLCEQVGYLIDRAPKKKEAYLKQLSAWADMEEQPLLNAVLRYVRRGGMEEDLSRAGLLQTDEQGEIKNEKDMVCWRVLGLPKPCCWQDEALFASFQRFYGRAEKEQALCMMTGELSRPARQHPKGIAGAFGNAKLISANDTTGFSFRGRFVTADQALTVGYEPSQKAHAALRWLAANQGVVRGGRVFLCWNPQGEKLPQADAPFLLQPEGAALPYLTDYREALRRALEGWKARLPAHSEAVIASLDAATRGRLAVTYFSEMPSADLLTHFCAWDEACCWHYGSLGVRSPSLYQLAVLAFGNRRDEDTIEAEDAALRLWLQRLIIRRAEGGALPREIAQALCRKCGQMQLYGNDLRERLLFAACAALRLKHHG